MYYIQESDKPCKILKFFNCIRLKDNEIILPIQKEKLTEKQSEKLATKTYKLIKISNCKKIAISKEIKKQEQYLNYLYSFRFRYSRREMVVSNTFIYVIRIHMYKKEFIKIRYIYINISKSSYRECALFFKKNCKRI